MSPQKVLVRGDVDGGGVAGSVLVRPVRHGERSAWPVREPRNSEALTRHPTGIFCCLQPRHRGAPREQAGHPVC